MKLYHRLMRGYYVVMMNSLVDSKQNELIYLKLFTKYRYHREKLATATTTLSIFVRHDAGQRLKTRE